MRAALLASSLFSLLFVDTSLAAGNSAAPRREFPLVAAGIREGAPSLVLEKARAAALAPLHDVQFERVALPGLGEVDLELHRVHVNLEPRAMQVDGKASGDQVLDSISMWTGKVAGAAESEAFLAFSPYGSRGFVAVGTRRVHLDAAPGDGRDWARGFSIWRVEDGEPLPGQKAGVPSCAGAIPRPGAAARVPPAGGAKPKSTSVVPIYECRIALETDTQFFGLFGDALASQTYLVELLGAVSDRYREQVGLILTFPYVGIHSTTDPWLSPEQGAGSLGMLYEFQAAWQNGGAPVAADCYHFVSGASLGGGIAYLPGVCDQTYGFAVSGDIGASTPFPVAQGPLNWDFMVVTHELGHNLGAPHTHDYCPPVDQCAPAGYFGQCQTQEVCTSAGTVMSYCHLCPGGLSNITTYLHPASVADCRNIVTTSCLPLYEGMSYFANLGYAKPGSNGTPALTVSYTSSTDVLSFAVTHAPASKPGILFIAASTSFLPLLGGTLVPAVQFFLPVTSNSQGAVTLAAPLPPGSVSFPGGATFWSQAWFSDPVIAAAATNGAEFELILP